MPGCFTGHLLDAARRREHPLAVHAAWVEGDRLVLAWGAELRTDLGAPLGGIARAGAVPLSALAGDTPVAADALEVEPRDARAPVGPGAVAVAVVASSRARRDDAPVGGDAAVAGDTAVGSDAMAARQPPAAGDPAAAAAHSTLEIRPAPGAPLLAFQDASRAWAPFPLNALGTRHTAAWAWPLLPGTIALDVVVVPPLLFFAPAVITMGD